MSADNIFKMSLVSLYLQVEQQDPCDILGLNDGSAPATAPEAKAAYRALALRLHPDKCENKITEELHTRLFQRVQEAYEALISRLPVGDKDPEFATGEDVKIKLPQVDDLPFKERLSGMRDARVAMVQAERAAKEEKKFRYQAKQERLAALYAHKNEVDKAKAELGEKKRALKDSRESADRYGKGSPQHLEASNRLEKYTALRNARIVAGTDATYEARETTDELRRISDEEREQFVKEYPILPPLTNAPVDKFLKLDFRNIPTPSFITGNVPRPSAEDRFLKKAAEKDAAREYKKQARLSERKQRSGHMLLDRNEEAEFSVTEGVSYIRAQYNKQLTKGRVTNLSLRDLERKERFYAERTRREYELKKYIKKHAPAQNVLTNKDGYYDYYEAARYVGIDYVEELSSIEERPFPEEDIEAWEENAKYIVGYSQGPQVPAILNKDWIHAEQKNQNIGGLHRDTIKERRDDVDEVAEDPVRALQQIAAQLDTSDEQVWPSASTKEYVVETEAVAMSWSEVVKKEPEVKEDVKAEDTNSNRLVLRPRQPRQGHQKEEVSNGVQHEIMAPETSTEHEEDAVTKIAQQSVDLSASHSDEQVDPTPETVQEHDVDIADGHTEQSGGCFFSIGDMLKSFTTYHGNPFFLRRWVNTVTGGADSDID